jgi:quercetin dioxygenase-like cupin family protein
MSDRDLDMEAAEFVLGTLSGPERAALDAERAHNPALAQAIGDWERRLAPLSAMVPQVRPSAGLWGRIEAGLDALPDARVGIVAREDGSWSEILPGVSLKVLREEGPDGTQTFLLKLAPGARVPPHNHPHPEECFVIEGTMEIGPVRFRAGDFVAYPAGVAHTEMYSPSGGVVLIRGGYA